MVSQTKNSELIFRVTMSSCLFLSLWCAGVDENVGACLRGISIDKLKIVLFSGSIVK